jgi:hypothetical protein
MEIDLDALFAEAVEHMTAENDVRWTLGIALQELYGDKGIDALQHRMTEHYLKTNDEEDV